MRSLLLVGMIVALLPQAAFAKAHLWKFTEVFSNADGSVQFIEMFVFDPAGTAEWNMGGKLLESNANTYVFPNHLPMENTFERWVLIATPGFVGLPGAPTPDFVIPAQFFDPAGDELRYRTTRDILTLPAGAVPVDGVTAYLRDGTTDVNSPTNFAGDSGSIDLTKACGDGVDNDGDGAIDYPADVGCRDGTWATEAPQCQDGVNNDPGQDALIDWDGGASAGLPPAEQTAPDPQCRATWGGREARKACGLGAELVLVLPLLLAAFRRRAPGGPPSARG